MESNKRKHIIKNIEKLMRITNYDQLKRGCLANGLLTQKMCQLIEDAAPRDPSSDWKRERHKKLLEKVTHRGPDAYQRFKNILSELNYEQALQLLNELNFNNDAEFTSMKGRGSNKLNEEQRTNLPVFEMPAVNNAETEELSNTATQGDGWSWKLSEDKYPLEEYTAAIKPRIVHKVIKSTKIHRNNKVGTYAMQTKNNRGVFLMVNIIDFPVKTKRRNGAEEDAESLLYLFKELGFKLFAYTNLTSEQFFIKLRELIDSDYTRHAESFFMALMSHGSLDGKSMGVVEFTDGSVVKVSAIEECFQNNNCRNLLNKPKVFIFPFCRGDNPDYGHHHYEKTQTDTIITNPPIAVKYPNNIPFMSDVMICWATTRGFATHRDPLEGSWYIQKFCKLMSEHAHDTAFDDILKMIQLEISWLRSEDNGLQTGSYENHGFKRILYLNPGYSEEDERMSAAAGM